MKLAVDGASIFLLIALIESLLIQLLCEQGAITKRMTAIEEMAGMDVLCSDKTGTLTLNKLSVDKNLIEVRIRHKLRLSRNIESPGISKLPELTQNMCLFCT